ncbi:MAG: hypothetical protein ACYSWP_24575 [Planctomycetota bacterium]|jgi:hypothetical protein
MINAEKFGFISPAPVIAFVIGFVLYAILAKAGLEPETLEMATSEAVPAPQVTEAGESTETEES